MTFKRRALGALTRGELLEVGRGLELDVSTGIRLDELIDPVAGSKRATLERILPTLSRDTLKSICFAVGEPAEGREKQIIVDRISEGEGSLPVGSMAFGGALRSQVAHLGSAFQTILPSPPCTSELGRSFSQRC